PLFVRHVGDRHALHLMAMLVHHGDEPSLPVPARRDFAVSEFARQHHRLLTRRGVARQVHSLWIVQAFSPVGDMKMVPRHARARSVSERPPAVTRFRLRAQNTPPARLLAAGPATPLPTTGA